VFGLPAQLLVRPGRVGGEVEDVSGTAANDLVRQVATDGGGEGLDHLEHGAASAGAQVPRADARVLRAEVVEGNQVTFGQVEDVDVIADGGAVFRVVVCSVR